NLQSCNSRSLTRRSTHKVLLDVERLTAATNRNVSAIRLQFTRFRVVFQIRIKQHVTQVTFGLGISYRGNHLNAVFQVSGHPVGAADVKLIVATVLEPKDAAV